ncbi:MAG: helix-turn-helix domain-containing protein [Clostridiales bacterium]|nr:helix-turn-helix domain-containing protein [Clostridiales bacterium]
MKKTTIQKHWQFLRFHSVFVKTMAVLLLLVFVMIGIFYVFVNFSYRQGHRQEEKQDCYSMIHMRNEEIEASLLSLKVQASDFLQGEDTVSLALKGNGNHAEQDSLMLEVALNLYKFVRENAWTDSSYLLVKATDMIMTSDKRIISREECTEMTDLDQYSAENGLCWYEDELFWIQGFPQEKPLLVMAVKIDRQQMFEDVWAELGPEEIGMYLYFQNRPIFEGFQNYPEEDALMTANRVDDGNGFYTGKSEVSDQMIYSYVSDYTGFQWICLSDQKDLFSYSSGMLKSFLFVSGLMIILLIAASVVLVQFVYFPLQKIVVNMAKSKDGMLATNKAGNELELIENLYQENQEKQEVLREMLSQVGTAVQEKLLSSLVSGDENKNGDVVDMLCELDPSFSLEGSYQVLLVHIFYGPDYACSLREQAIHRWSLQQVSQEYWEGKASNCIFQGKDENLILIIKYNENTSTASAKRLVNDFEENLKDQRNLFSFHMEMGVGRVYRSVEDVHEAYLDAEKNLQERLYYQRESTGEDKSIQQYAKKAESILQEELGYTGQYTEKIKLLLQEVMNEAAYAPKIYSMVSDVILERLIQLNVERKDRWMTAKKQLEENHLPLGDQDPRTDIMNTFVEETLQAVEQAVGKEKFRYIESAKKYIEAHYNDNGLSLNVVSEFCGISSSYLSRLFTDYLPPGFLEYLNQYRVEQAAVLILNTSYTIAEIGFKTGFNSPQNFIRVFKKYKGETPGQYRMRKGENQ